MWQQILNFWFEQLQPADWWKVDAALDQRIAQEFGAVWQAASRAEYASWREHAQGRLAEIIVLDQFSRNIHRGTPLAFSQDGMALVLAQEMQRNGMTQELSPVQRSFAYLPYMHSESALVHQDAEVLYRELAFGNTYQFELRHKAIIDQFGRYPHRNAILGRTSTEAELSFLQLPGSSF